MLHTICGMSARSPDPAPRSLAVALLHLAGVASLVTVRAMVLHWTAREGDDRLHLVGKLYVRGPHNRLLDLDFTPQSTVWWATQRALIALNDPRDPSECRLVLDGQALRPRRSLAKSGVHNGDTLDLVAAKTVPAVRASSLASIR